DARRGVKLYVKRVFIMDDADQLLPAYLRFVRGVVDSADLPLNVSREILQESRDVRAIRDGSAKRILGLLEDLAKDQPEAYAEFWTQFGQVLKEGVGEDPANKDRIAGLLRFATTQSDSPAQTVSLADYVGRMKEGQDKIYYLSADSYAAAAHSLDLDALADEEEKKQQAEAAEAFKPTIERLKTALGERVKEVRVTARLVDSPACVVVDEHELSPHLLRMLKAAGQDAPEVKPILE